MTKVETDHEFLRGTGKMGERLKKFDWSLTPLGSPSAWPSTLKISVGNLLRTPVATMLLCGDAGVCFCNEAMSSIFGDYSPGLTAAELWPDDWRWMKPLYQQVLATGEAVTIARDSTVRMREYPSALLFAFSLITGGDGVSITCLVPPASTPMPGESSSFPDLISQAPVAIAITRGEEFVFERINHAMLDIIHRSGAQSMIGRRLLDIVPELAPQPVFVILKEVLASGNAYHGNDVEVELVDDGVTQRRYFDITFTRLPNSSGEFCVLHMLADVTERVMTRRKTEESEAKLRSILNSAPTAMAVFAGPDLILENPNQLFIELMAAGPNIEGRPFREVLKGLVEHDENFIGLIENVRVTGHPFEAQEAEVFFRSLNETRYFNISFLPLRDADGTVYAVLDVSVDVTEQVVTRKRVEQNEAKFRSLIEEAPFATALYIGPQLVIDTVNDAMLQLWDKPASVVGGTFEEALPELQGQPFAQLLRNVYETGREYVATGQSADLMIRGQMRRQWYNFTCKAVRNHAGEVYGIVHMAVNVTRQVQAQQRLEESEEYARSLFYNSPIAMLVFVGDDMVVREANEKALAMFGREIDFIGQPIMQSVPELADTPLYEQYREVLKSGLIFNQSAQKMVLAGKDSRQESFYDYTYKPLYNGEGEIYGVMCTAIDMTGQITDRQRLEEKEAALEAALEQVRLSKEAAELGTFDMDLRRGTLHWDDRCRILFGISHHGPVTYEKDFVSGLHPDDRDRITSIIEKCFIKSVSNGDYDVEYRTVGAEDGVERWVKAKGKVYFDSEDRPVRFVGSVLDITAEVDALRRTERLVAQRTRELAEANEHLSTLNKELQRSNANLEEFAHAASHDLKEPIRKIHFFTQQLREQLGSQLKEAEIRSFSRIENATQRMGNLIDDLLLYSHVSQRPHETEAVDLNEKVQRVLEDLELDVQEKKAVIEVGKLPVVQGYRRQLQQLFQNLISNALKYKKPQMAPVITISAEQVLRGDTTFHAIAVSDNGIGFEPEYADKIFQMFTRLHGKTEYSGTGVGLSIVKKVVENHDGFIEVYSEPGVGSKFVVHLPVQ